MGRYVTYETKHEAVDYTTGEIASKSETKVLKVERSAEKFFKLFVENVGALYGLSAASSFKVLFAILNMATARDNTISMAHGMRKRIGEAVEVHPNLVTKALKELLDKQIIKKTNHKDYFRLNPHIFGQGSFIDVEKLRQSIEFQYDFKKGEITRTLSADSITSTGMDILQNPHKYDLVDIEKNETENESNIGLTVKHKDEIDDDLIKAYPKEQNLFTPRDSNNANDDIVENNIKFDLDKDKENDNTTKQSLEIISKMLDRINELHAIGKVDEAMSLQKRLEKYIDKLNGDF